MSRSRSPTRNARREPRGRGGRIAAGKDQNGRPRAGARPKVTAEDLDAEMDNYWGSSGGHAAVATDTNQTSGSVPGVSQTSAPAAATATVDEDVDMIE